MLLLLAVVKLLAHQCMVAIPRITKCGDFATDFAIRVSKLNQRFRQIRAHMIWKKSKGFGDAGFDCECL